MGSKLRVAAIVIAGLGAAGFVVFDRGEPLADLPFIVVNFLIATIAGELSGRRTRAVATRQGGRPRTAKALAAERLLLQERGRLARELHDSLGHTVNVMVLQAGVGRRVFADNPDYAQEALTSIETTGRRALDELDRLLRVLSPMAEAPRGTVRADGVRPASWLSGSGPPAAGGDAVDGISLTPGGARALYRIVQEALTNAVRHTSAGRIQVEVSQVGDQVLLEVVNEGHGFRDPVPGRGLVNMRERAHAGGWRARGRPDRGGFRVRAVLPAVTAVSP